MPIRATPSREAGTTDDRSTTSCQPGARRRETGPLVARLCALDAQQRARHLSAASLREDVVFRKLFGRRQIIISRPAAIERILVDNPENYRRTAAGIRILRPLLGKGLLLSRRRGLAASAPHLGAGLRPAHDADAGGPCRARRRGFRGSSRNPPRAPVNLLAAMQFLALEIAGASMFSLETARFGVELRGLIRAYAARLGRPSLLDFLLPPSLPSPRDVARWRFRRRWTRLDRADHRRAPRAGRGRRAARPVRPAVGRARPGERRRHSRRRGSPTRWRR